MRKAKVHFTPWQPAVGHPNDPKHIYAGKDAYIIANETRYKFVRICKGVYRSDWTPSQTYFLKVYGAPGIVSYGLEGGGLSLAEAEDNARTIIGHILASFQGVTVK